MSKSILGISAFYHDSAAAMVRDGRIVAAAQEERFSRKKHDERFPSHAVAYCLEEAGIAPGSLDYVAFYEKPFLKFDRLMESYLAYAPRGFKSFSKAIPQWLKTKLHTPREIRRGLRKEFHGPILFIEHHLSHAASAFFPSPFESAAILTLDGVGEWDTTSISVGEGDRVHMLKTIAFPHSIGLLYSAFTYFTGFRVNSGEYKLMGLAPYGTPEYAELILEKLVDIKADGSFALNMDYFSYPHGLTMTDGRLESLLGVERRRPGAALEPAHMNVAASIQLVTEKLVSGLARHAREITGKDKLCLAGGVALNCVANGKLLRENVFDDLWIQPAAGDAGGALGAALFTHYQLLDNKRRVSPQDGMRGSLLGPRYSNDSIEAVLLAEGAVYERVDDDAALLEKTARLLADGNIVGWFHGRMEYGPRALGSRSILADPRSGDMQSRVNLKIKFRESFRPFAPAVLEEDAKEYFDLAAASPYMLLVAPVADRLRRSLSVEEQALMKDADPLKRVNVKRSSLPAVTHVDYSARVQTVNEQRHGRLHQLLKSFKQLTGCGVLVNTSFNVRGEPLVNRPLEALRCFLSTGMDALVLENCILLKTGQPEPLLRKYRGYETSFDPD